MHLCSPSACPLFLCLCNSGIFFSPLNLFRVKRFSRICFEYPLCLFFRSPAPSPLVCFLCKSLFQCSTYARGFLPLYVSLFWAAATEPSGALQRCGFRMLVGVLRATDPLRHSQDEVRPISSSCFYVSETLMCSRKLRGLLTPTERSQAANSIHKGCTCPVIRAFWYC